MSRQRFSWWIVLLGAVSCGTTEPPDVYWTAGTWSWVSTADSEWLTGIDLEPDGEAKIWTRNLLQKMTHYSIHTPGTYTIVRFRDPVAPIGVGTGTDFRARRLSDDRMQLTDPKCLPHALCEFVFRRVP